MKDNSLGGSEKAVAYLASYLPKDYTIYVSGGVTNETVDNVVYLHLNQLQDVINTTPFHTIICSRYIAFFEMFKEISFHKFYIWAHDTTLLPYGYSYNQKFTDTQLISKWQHYIDGCICQTPWHAEIYKQRFPELKKKITIINNGIDTTLISSHTNTKRKNKFIYTSCSERGLHVLLELWADILHLLPDASLVISSYNTFPSDKNAENDIKMKTIIDEYPQSITHRGKLSTEMLYQEMQSAEYWVYPTSFCETSCITAMEMLANGVICIYYPVAGLADTMKGYGFPVQNTKEILDCLDYLDKLTVNAEQKNEMRLKGMTYAVQDCAWMNRAVEWTNLLFPEKKKKQMLQIINLKRRPDRKERMIQALNDANMLTNYEFSEAVDGKELVPSLELKQLFAGNNFNYRKGVMGCALSHYNLWRQLLEDKDNEFYLIFEDDVELCKGFQKKIADLAAEMAKKDVIYLGYSRYSSAERKQVIAEFKTITEETPTITLQKLNANRSGGGAFCYSIHKNAAKKYIDYIDKNGIKYAIDYVMLFAENVESYEVNPLLVISEHTFDAPVIDTDIQSQYDCLEF
jgi:GR25 family glycosyltransferase involved in LPS biosynthesis/glycosyltransferase involved in cell wall biosynthesis